MHSELRDLAGKCWLGWVLAAPSFAASYGSGGVLFTTDMDPDSTISLSGLPF